MTHLCPSLGLLSSITQEALREQLRHIHSAWCGGQATRVCSFPAPSGPTHAQLWVYLLHLRKDCCQYRTSWWGSVQPLLAVGAAGRLAAVVSWGCGNSSTAAAGLQQQTLTYNSGGWETQDQGAGGFRV